MILTYRRHFGRSKVTVYASDNDPIPPPKGQAFVITLFFDSEHKVGLHRTAWHRGKPRGIAL